MHGSQGLSHTLIFLLSLTLQNQKEIQNNNVMMRRPGLSTFYPTSTPAGGLDLIVTAFEENIRPGQCQPYFDIFVEFDQSKTTV